MRDILVDQSGDFRCPQCHGRNFQHKRTLKAKAGLGVVVLPAALLAPKRMKCLVCGEYSKTDNAKRWRDRSLEPSQVPLTATALPPLPPISLELDPSQESIVIHGATSSVEAVIAAKLVHAIPTLDVSTRQALAARIARGQSVTVCSTLPGECAALISRMQALGLDAAVGSAADPSSEESQ